MGKICPETDTGTQTRFRQITSKLSERAIEFADQKMELGKILNPEYNIFRDQPIAGASPLRINTLLCREL